MFFFGCGHEIFKGSQSVNFPEVSSQTSGLFILGVVRAEYLEAVEEFQLAQSEHHLNYA